MNFENDIDWASRFGAAADGFTPADGVRDDVIGRIEGRRNRVVNITRGATAIAAAAALALVVTSLGTKNDAMRKITVAHPTNTNSASAWGVINLRDDGWETYDSSGKLLAKGPEILGDQLGPALPHGAVETNVSTKSLAFKNAAGRECKDVAFDDLAEVLKGCVTTSVDSATRISTSNLTLSRVDGAGSQTVVAEFPEWTGQMLSFSPSPNGALILMTVTDDNGSAQAFLIENHAAQTAMIVAGPAGTPGPGGTPPLDVPRIAGWTPDNTLITFADANGTVAANTTVPVPVETYDPVSKQRTSKFSIGSGSRGITAWVMKESKDAVHHGKTRS
ncbi:MAG: hypothetical protein WBD02_04195 [Acidimicrobiia bacterium]